MPLTCFVWSHFFHIQPCNLATAFYTHAIPCTTGCSSHFRKWLLYMRVSINRGTPKSSISMGFPINKTIHFGGNPPKQPMMNARRVPCAPPRCELRKPSTNRWGSVAAITLLGIWGFPNMGVPTMDGLQGKIPSIIGCWLGVPLF